MATTRSNNNNRAANVSAEVKGPHGLTKRQFVFRAIDSAKLRGTDKDGNPYRGLHVVFSRFNDGFLAEFGEPSKPTTDAMVAEGLIVAIPSYRGVMLYRPENAPAPRDNAAERGAKALDILFS